MSAGIQRFAVVLAALFGAAGTIGAAVAAHGGDARLAGTAAAMALVHAPVLLVLGLAGAGRLRIPSLPIALIGLGIVLFCGDLALRAAYGASLFARAAPTGGSLVILGWLSLGVLALLPPRRA